MRHFIDIADHPAATLRAILADAAQTKAALRAGDRPRPLAGKVLAMIFEKNSTRTRVSFEVAMKQLGGDVVALDAGSSQLGRGETVADTARVLSRYVDAIMIRTNAHAKILELRDAATVPVINGLTDDSHPCQIMADVMTVEEWRGPIAGQKVAWLGDGNNVAASWIEAAAVLGFDMALACPEPLRPARRVLDWAEDRAPGRVSVGEAPGPALAGADCVVTDTWISMGQSDAANRHNLLRPYRVDAAAMAAAKPDAIFMHCLPAHRGEEVTDEVIDGPRSAVWDEAENRLHAQKAILKWCLAAG
ncbi:MAG: ornithine carbamoyltransferase [Alphaproteobacteria bacterium]